MIRHFSVATVIAALALLLLAVTVLAATICWGTTTEIRDENGVVLACGDIVQLIRDTTGDGANPPDASGSPAAGNDLLVDSSTICYGTFFPGMFTKNTPSAAGYSEGWQLYVRAWNANSLSGATYYGNSQIYTTSGAEGYTLKVTIANTNLPKPIPTAVDLAYFTATSNPDHVLIEWETVSELGVLGFDLHRGVSDAGPWQKLNPQTIAAANPGGIEGRTYSWVDSAAPRGQMVYYRLDETSTTGSRKSIAVTAVYYGTDRRLWLPVLYR